MSSSSATQSQSSIKVDTAVMFGDSITQQAWSTDGLGSALANAYQRKLDVLNRGLSGYNTAWALPVMKQWLPLKTKMSSTSSDIKLLFIWFGANDAALPPSPQGLSLQEFKANLHIMIKLLLDPDSIYHSPATKIVLLTPPPVDADIRNNELASRTPSRVADRDAERTRLFAVAVIQVAQEAGVFFLDTWTIIMNAAAKDGLSKYLSDGLHLTADGYRVISMEVATLIQSKIPELYWENMPQVFPHWSELIPDESRF